MSSSNEEEEIESESFTSSNEEERFDSESSNEEFLNDFKNPNLIESLLITIICLCLIVSISTIIIICIMFIQKKITNNTTEDKTSLDNPTFFIIYDNGIDLYVETQNVLKEENFVTFKRNTGKRCTGRCLNCPPGQMTGKFTCWYKGAMFEAEEWCMSKLNEACLGVFCESTTKISCN